MNSCKKTKSLLVLFLSLGLIFSLSLSVLALAGVSNNAYDFSDEEKSRADLFIAYVDSFGELGDLDDKLEAITVASSEGVIFEDESYPGISEALQKLETFKAETLAVVQICDRFIEAVDTAITYDESNDYPALSEALAVAKSYLSKLDNTYDGISGAVSTYGFLSSAWREKEEFTAEFLSAVERMKSIEDYQSFSKAYDGAMDYTKHENFIAEYSGVDEAFEYLEGASELMDQIVMRANKFITYVNTLGASGDLVKDLLNSYAEREGVDFTVPGASAALSMLDSAIADYNQRAEKANADFSYV